MNFLAALYATALLGAVSFARLTLGEALLLLWVPWLVLLPAQTWMEYLAAMNLRRLKHGGGVLLPVLLDERCNEPDADRVARLLYPGAALDNFLLAQLAALLYFRVVPIPWKDRGLTFLLNRLEVRNDRTGYRARALKRRWLNRYAPEGFHK